MPAFVIFVEGTDTEPAKLPVYIVENEEHASLICEGMKESDYQIFDFSFKHCSRSDRGKFAVWATMICDAREGVYGNIVAGIYRMIDGAYSIMSGRRGREKSASDANSETGNGGSTKTTQDDATTDDNGQPPVVRTLRAGGADEERAGTDGVPESIFGFLGGEDLADALRVHPSRRDAFFQQLLRKRKSLGDDCWHQVTEPQPNSPRFLYLADSPALQRLAANYKTPKPA